jgi:hypothetical protein
LFSALLIFCSCCALGTIAWFFSTSQKPMFSQHPLSTRYVHHEQNNADVLLNWLFPHQGAPPFSRWVFNASDYQSLPVSREPSAAVALPRHKGFLVLDDEPGDAPSGGMLFYRIHQGRLRSIPVKLPSLGLRWDDWEGATASKNTIYLMTSHSRASKSRCRLCRFPRKDVVSTAQSLHIPNTMECRGGRAQRALFVRVLKKAARKYGFTLPARFETLSAKNGGLDLEGIAWDRKHNALLLGLRGPLATFGHLRYAILLEARWDQQTFSVRFRSLLDLRGRGIRDLTTLPSGKILLSAGPMGYYGGFDLYTFSPQKAVKQPVRRLTSSSFPPLRRRKPFKPEALVWFSNRLFVLSDNGVWGGRPAHYLVLPKNNPQ